MADRLEKSKRKRRCEMSHKLPGSKRQKLVKVGKEPKTITDINYDCLERILNFLDFESLLNVAGTCKRLQTAAADQFAFHKNEIYLTLCDNREPGIREDHHFPQVIYVYGLKFCLPFLRCFGKRILSMTVEYGWAYVYEKPITKAKQEENGYLDRYVNKYCADTLTRITINEKRAFLNKNFPKPFKNVTSVVVYRFECKNLPKFVKWFPNMRSLEIKKVMLTRALLPCLFHI